MTQKEYQDAIKNDSYLIPRKKLEDWEIRLFLREVGYHCPLCRIELQSKSQKKPSEKLFEIAHIYPNSPTKEQYEALYGLERLGSNSEAFENRIALCKACHGTQDYHTTTADYNNLLRIKKNCLQQTALHDITLSLGLENEVEYVLGKITTIAPEELSELNYLPVEICKKFTSAELAVKTKVTGYITAYFPLIRDTLKNLDGKNNFLFSILCGQIKACFEKMETITTDKAQIFKSMVEWIMRKTNVDSIEACEAIVAFFIQDCEVFREITE